MRQLSIRNGSLSRCKADVQRQRTAATRACRLDRGTSADRLPAPLHRSMTRPTATVY